MVEIKTLVSEIDAELNDAEHYAKNAVKIYDKNTKLSETYDRLSKQEIEHARELHEAAKNIIKEFTGAVPVSMQAVWDWEHECMIEHEEKILKLLGKRRR